MHFPYLFEEHGRTVAVEADTGRDVDSSPVHMSLLFGTLVCFVWGTVRSRRRVLLFGTTHRVLVREGTARLMT